ncbi:F0F1 ATP synthase subunit alpha [Candidatus Mycoplasma mahonii]|uniref:F0F1 ATP synthase subunit alpha n=1 Tax=Candidatus Mycoplasma mahonii TaxID=3004105 RepID=UPI0026F28F4F|nr:F0F1 ATP synthase subunit alpha [Candidatus Mycoplasma mahonii]WKX02150.1 F0F1 ATP synthase subunit alpha [Candidatus Mycoplasma mahonii]
MAVKANEISAILRSQIKNYGKKIRTDEVGEVITIGDGIALVSGLDNAMLGELLEFPGKVFALALNLEEDAIGAVLLGRGFNIKEGDLVKRTGKIISIPVGDAMLGRVVDALGMPLDAKAKPKTVKTRPAFRVAPGVMTRKEVDQPMATGLVSIDSMVPIGRGQRELIIGDRQTGKTAIALDTIINQKGNDVNVVYVAIGQKNSSVAQIVEKLNIYGAMEYTTIVVASASDMAPLQYLAPFAGVTIAEEWMEHGKDVLIIYDDLSKHAVAYRTLSLLLRRPPGREAYPGDIFYLHSQLLERAARVNEDNGGGSITALPIIETQAGDISAYIPTNVISITDGQIFTMTHLFNAGQRPAVDPGYSVSRVGSTAQIKAMKQVSSSLKLELAQYNEMAAFLQFGSDLDESTRKILSHGKKVLEIMKQDQYKPLTQIDQTIILLSVKERLVNPIPVLEIARFKNELVKFFKSDKKAFELKKLLIHSKAFDDILLSRFIYIIAEFVKRFLKTIVNYSAKENDILPKIDAPILAKAKAGVSKTTKKIITKKKVVQKKAKKSVSKKSVAKKTTSKAK